MVDDINGWNFLGGKDGQVMEATMREGDREFLRLKDKYADYIFDGKNYNKVIDGKLTKVADPENIDEYNYFLKRYYRNLRWQEVIVVGNLPMC